VVEELHFVETFVEKVVFVSKAELMEAAAAFVVGRVEKD
jgi:hypothetical protein